ncbi:MAG: hypothetical protein JW843_00870, partial [Candidatus Aminicenantes bacterium]|nr:hypothetical protein [Candidatus Aminicenantes bacterium]
MKKHITLILAVLLAGTLLAQTKLQLNPGGYHGELDYPISWKRYYAYEEWTRIMRELQQKYPKLCDIQSIGKSRMG